MPSGESGDNNKKVKKIKFYHLNIHSYTVQTYCLTTTVQASDA